MEHESIYKIAKYVLYVSFILLIIVSFVPFELNIKKIIAPIGITLFGVSGLIAILSHFWKFKLEDYDYFRSILIGIFGGLTVWFFSTIDFSFPNGIMLGINDIVIKLVFGILILVIGYKFLRRKNDPKKKTL
jgi:fluoride ion exporter CrcB/FEX